MEPNQQNIINQPVPHVAPKSHYNLVTTIVVAIVMLLIGLTSGYLLFANKSEINQLKATETLPTPNPTISLTPTIDPTLGWKTYTNSFFQFSLKYPQEVKVLDQSSTNNFNEGAKRNLRSDFISFELINGVTMAITLQENPFYGNVSPVVDKNAEILQIQGNKAYLYNYFEEGPMPARGYWTDFSMARGEKVYYIYILSPETEGSKLELMKQITSTFKFTQ